MRGLPLLLVFRAGTGVEVVTAGVAGGEGLVPVKDYAHLVCYCVVRGAHDGKYVAVTGTGSQGAETTGREAYAHGVRGLSFLNDGIPVVLRLDTVNPLYLLDVVVLVLFAKKWRRSIALGHYRHGHGGVAHLAILLFCHSTVQLFDCLIESKPHGPANQVELPMVLGKTADGRCLLQHLDKAFTGIALDGSGIPLRVLLPQFLDTDGGHNRKHNSVDEFDTHSLILFRKPRPGAIHSLAVSVVFGSVEVAQPLFFRGFKHYRHQRPEDKGKYK